MSKTPKAILLVYPVGDPPTYWPDGPVVAQLEEISWPDPGFLAIRQPIFMIGLGTVTDDPDEIYATISGHSTAIVFDRSTQIKPPTRAVVIALIREWRTMFSGRWRFELRYENDQRRLPVTSYMKTLPSPVPQISGGKLAALYSLYRREYTAPRRDVCKFLARRGLVKKDYQRGMVVFKPTSVGIETLKARGRL